MGEGVGAQTSYERSLNNAEIFPQRRLSKIFNLFSQIPGVFLASGSVFLLTHIQSLAVIVGGYYKTLIFHSSA